MLHTINHEVGSGTWLQGYVTTTLDQLIKTFGEPQRYIGEDKVTVNWSMVFEDGTIATIYDWKRYEMGTPQLTEVMEYNIGGTTREAVTLVREALRKGGK